MYKIWLDDVRPKPDNFDLHVKTASACIELLERLSIQEVSLDHDLGDDIKFGTGYDVAKWIEEQAFLGNLPRLKWNIHSANPIGRERMEAALINADKFWKQKENSNV